MTGYNGGNPADQSDSILTTRFDHVEAEKAYLVYAAMKRAEVEQPRLAAIPMWNAHKAVAYSVFEECFRVAQ